MNIEEEYQINITRPSVRVPPRYTPPMTMSSLFKNGAATELDPYAPVKKHAVLFCRKEFLNDRKTSEINDEQVKDKAANNNK